jgi:hypothetical protein
MVHTTTNGNAARALFYLDGVPTTFWRRRSDSLPSRGLRSWLEMLTALAPASRLSVVLPKQHWVVKPVRVVRV